MSQTFSNLAVHLVFATKFRRPWLEDSVREELHAYIGAMLKRVGAVAIEIGSVEDHPHILYDQPRTVTVSKVVEIVKSSSSGWLRRRGGTFADFRWQNGFSIFSVSPEDVEGVRRYIVNQRAHHSKEVFEDEYRRLLRQAGSADDERYMWD